MLGNKALSDDSFNPLIMVFDTIGKHIMRTVMQASNKKSISNNHKISGKYYEKLQGKGLLLKVVKVKTYLINFFEFIEEKQNSKNDSREVDVFVGRQAGSSYIKGDPLNGYYDFVITEGSYKFWVVFQVINVF